MYEFMVINVQYIKKSLSFLEYKSIGGFLIKKESQISLLVTYSIAILFVMQYIYVYNPTQKFKHSTK